MAKKQKFRRTAGHNYSKLGVRRKKKQIYRKPKGGDNKLRLNKAGRLRKVKIGFRSKKNQRDLIKGLKVVRVMNVKDLNNIKMGMIGLIGKIGDKKKKEIADQAKKEKIQLANLNPEKFLMQLEEKTENKKEKKKKRKEKKQARDKKSKEKSPEEKTKEENKK